MKPSEFRNQVNRMLARERKNPLAWFYLSFAGDEGWRGAAFIEAHGPTEAVYLAHRKQISPGGEVMLIKVPTDELPAEQYRTRLLDKEEVERATGAPVMTLQQIMGDNEEED